MKAKPSTAGGPALVAFDLDGTLIDSIGDLAVAVNRLLDERGDARDVEADYGVSKGGLAMLTKSLALELAATWLRAMSCQQIAVQLQRSLDFLSTPLRNVSERHRSMRAVFDQSWQLLSDAERQVLTRLSVFRGGFNLEAAEQVAAASLSIVAAM